MRGSALRERLGRVHDHRQRLVVDDDRLAGVLGDVGVVGDDRGDLLALEAHLVGGQHRLRVVAQGGHPREVAGRHHLAGEHQPDARDVPGLAGVDGADPGVGDRAAQDLHVQHAGQHDVVDVVAPAPDEAVVLDASATGAHPADLDLVQRLRRHGFSLSSGSAGGLRLGAAHLVGGPQHGLHDVLVAGAAAQVARERPPDLVLGRVGVLVEEGLGGQHHPGRAEAALEAVLLLEPLLQRVQLAGAGEALDRGHLVAVGLHREHRAALHRLPVDQHRAGAAVGGVAAGVGAGQPQPLAEQVGEQQPRLDVGGALAAVDGDGDAAYLDPVGGGLGDLVEQAGHACAPPRWWRCGSGSG